MSCEAELMFLLAGTRARRAAARPRIEVLAREADAVAMTDLLAQRRLLPLHGTRLLEAAPGELPDSFAAAVERSVELTRLHAAGIETLGRRVVERLAQEGIPALPLKGPQLATILYGDSGLRMTNDVDVLV